MKQTYQSVDKYVNFKIPMVFATVKTFRYQVLRLYMRST